MNKLNYLLFFAMLTASFLLISQTLSFDPNTGDEQLDEQLNEINSQAVTDLLSFQNEVSEKYHVGKDKISALLAIMEPVEIIIAYEISALTEKPIEQVIKSYKANKSEGWKAIAADLGVKSNTPEFSELKNILLEKYTQADEKTLSIK